MGRLFLKREQIHVVSAVTFGNILEWFDVYSFAYLAPTLGKVFLNFDSEINNLLFSFLIFGIGFITRPIGGILFGRIGDLIGRRAAFLGSIIFLTIPTFLMGLLPTYAAWGIWAPITLGLLRILQSVPTGGETPGAICYLFENSDPENRRFITSWNDVGNQIGAIIGISENFLMENYMSTEAFNRWGWRISFITGGIIGLFGIYLRHTLQETPIFHRMQKEHKIDKETVRALLHQYKHKILIGIAFGVVDASAFYLIATYFPAFLTEHLGFSFNQNILLSVLILFLVTILLPFFGRLGDKYSNNKILVFSSLLLIIDLFPIYYAINRGSVYLLLISLAIFLIPISAITALIAYIYADLFPPQVRFTGIGVSINIADGVIGGFTPLIATLLLGITGNYGSFIWFILFCALISLFSYIKYVKS